MNITEFLEARIAEDESTARRVKDGPGEPGGRGVWSVQIGVSGNDAKFAHVASDPDRIIAECAAKRAIISAHQSQKSEDDPGAWIVASNALIKALTAVYKDHPDYQQEWGA